MEEITEQEAKKMTEESKKEIKQIISKGGKITNTIIYEKDKVTIIKIEPANGKTTSSNIIQNKDKIVINP